MAVFEDLLGWRLPIRQQNHEKSSNVVKISENSRKKNAIFIIIKMPTFINIVRSAIYLIRMICLKGFKKYQRAFLSSGIEWALQRKFLEKPVDFLAFEANLHTEVLLHYTYFSIFSPLWIKMIRIVAQAQKRTH